jgi:hypothetical protein
MKTEVFWVVPSCVPVNCYRLSRVGQSKNLRYSKYIKILALQPAGYRVRPKILKSFFCPVRGSDNANISFNMRVVSSGGGKSVIGILTYMFGGNDEGPLIWWLIVA